MDHEIKLQPVTHLLSCPFCGGDVEHPKLVAGEASRFEIACKPCNLTMHEEVPAPGDQNMQDYARFRLVGRWSDRQLAPGASPPVFRLDESLTAQES